MRELEEPPPKTAQDPPHDPAADPTADRRLLDAVVCSQVLQNRAHAARLQAVHDFHARRVTERGSGAGFFALTPLQETQVEIAPLLGISERAVQFQLDTVTALLRWFPRLWQRCLTGRLDIGRAQIFLDQLPHLATDLDREDFANAVQDWFDKHDPFDPAGPDQATPGVGSLCRISRIRIQRAARYQRLKRRQRQPHETFADAFRKRHVSLRVDEESGMAAISATLAAHDGLTADHRLTMIAKKRAQAPGETRTLAQLRLDSLLDLIHGRLVVPATTGDLEHHEPCDRTCRVTGDHGDHGDHDGVERVCPLHPLVLTGENGGPLGGYARPVVQVTVPITTLLGVEDHPGLLSGGIAIPADYARHLCGQPDSTWYRMLTDDVGTFLSLSTSSYQPTDPIWRTTTARDHTCVWPGCRRPAVLCECDHRIPHPEGATSEDNLQPLCRRHHRVKHAPDYTVVRNPDGSYTWTTRHGATLTTPASEQPVGTWPSTSTGTDQDRIDAEFTALTSPMEEVFARLVTTR